VVSSTGAERPPGREHGSGRPPERRKRPSDGRHSRILGVSRHSSQSRRARGEFDQAFQNLAFLGAGNGVLAIDQETRDTVDAESVRVQVLRMDVLRALGRQQKIPAGSQIEPVPGADRTQGINIANIQAFDEMRPEDRVHKLVRNAIRRRVSYQPMRVHAVGRAPYRGKIKYDPLRRPEIGDRGIEPPGPILGPNFRIM